MRDLLRIFFMIVLALGFVLIFLDVSATELGSLKPGFPFWPWHGHSVHPRCPEYDVFPR